MHNPTNFAYQYTHAFYIAACNGLILTIYHAADFTAHTCSEGFWLPLTATVLSLHREGYYERFQASCNLQPVRCHHCLLQVVLRWLMYTSCTGQVEVLKVAVMTYMRSQICDLSSIDSGNEAHALCQQSFIVCARHMPTPMYGIS